MRSNYMVLLKALLLSTSRINIYKHTTDKKVKGKIAGSIVGVVIIYLMFMAYCIATCIGYGKMGMIDSVPVLNALIISVLAFFFTFLKTNGYLFNFKEYDMLMSLPFEAKTVASCKFLYMYINSLSWYLSISVAMLIGYGIFAKPSIIVYPLWIILTLILPLIPMLLASFVGFLIARIGANFRKTNIVQTIFSILFVILAMSTRFIIESQLKDDKWKSTLTGVSDITRQAGTYYLPAGWFSDAITEFSISGILLLAGISILLFAVVFIIVGRSYRNINSALKSHAAARNYKMKEQKQKSIANAIAFKEFKRMTGSTIYMTNAALGEILATLFGLATLIVGFEKLIRIFVKDAPIDVAMIQPAIPFIVYFFIGMMATTACSPSLEGKNYWIVQSLPIPKKQLYQGKMLFNIYLTVPFSVLSTVLICIAAKVPVLESVFYVILGIALCAFSTTFGCVCGIKFMKLDWVNETEAIKNNTAVTVYLLPSMFITMGLVVGAVFLGMVMNHLVVMAGFIVVALVLAAVCYFRAMVLAEKRG